MKAFLFLSLILSAAVAQADIRRPDPRAPSDKVEVSGDSAEDLYNSLNGERVVDMRGDSLRTYISSYRVFESQEMLVRIICKKEKSGRMTTVYSCVIETSSDGRKLGPFVPRRRLG